MTILLVIKGDRDAAVQSAAWHDIDIKVETTTSLGTVALCNSRYAAVVQSWFIEDLTRIKVGEGYPQGSLLFYNERQEEEVKP